MRKFPKISFTKTTQEKIENLNSPIIIKGIYFSFLVFPQGKYHDQTTEKQHFSGKI